MKKPNIYETGKKYNHNTYQEKIEEIARKYNAVGLSVALVANGKVIDTFLFGDAVKGELVMTEDTKIRIASISKIYIGLATMLSVEDEKMSLDEDIGTYWGFKIKTYSNKGIITPRSILTHTSSIINAEDISETEYNNMSYRLSSGIGIRNIISSDIGNYYYNNYAFDVLGMTIELANKKTLDDILKEKLYNKLGIDAAFYGGDLFDTSNVATIYRSDGSIGYSADKFKTIHSEKPASKGATFCGGVITSVKDLGKIIALLANDGIYEEKRYLSESCINQLEYHEKHKLGDYYQCQPLLYRTNVYGQEEFYYHTGSAYGAYNLAGYNPVTRQGIAILTSGAIGDKDENNIYCVCSEITKILLNIKK